MSFHMIMDIMFKVILIILLILTHKVFKGGK